MAYRKPQKPKTKRKPKTAVADLGRHVKSAGKKILKGLKESPFLKKTKPKIKPKPKPPKPIKPKPKPVRKAKGGLVSRGTKFKGIF